MTAASESSIADARQAVADAAAAFPLWSAQGPGARRAVLSAAADELVAMAPEIIDAMQDELGWEMTECVVALAPGDRHSTSWAPVGDTDDEAFGFEGEALLIEAPRRAVTTERMKGTEGSETLNDLNLYEVDGATLITLLIEYPDKETRDMILATGMADGMEASYARLERDVLVASGR